MLKVFFIRIPGEEKWDMLFHTLKSDVLEGTYNEVLAYKNKGVGIRRLLGEVVVRYLLRHDFGMEKNTYQIFREEKGKPYLKGCDHLFFNLSHSGKWIVCAFSDREVGIDIEKRGVARMEVANRFFHEMEINLLNTLNGVSQNLLFYDLWSIKESFLKYTGKGLARPLNSFRVDLKGKDYTLYEGKKRLPLFVRECKLDEDYACFVCAEIDEQPRLQELMIADL